MQYSNFIKYAILGVPNFCMKRLLKTIMGMNITLLIIIKFMVPKKNNLILIASLCRVFVRDRRREDRVKTTSARKYFTKEMALGIL